MAGVFRLAPPSQLRPRRQEKRPTLWKKTAALVMFLTCPCGRSAPMIGSHHGAHFPYWDGMCGGRHRCPVRFESSSHNAGVPHWASQIKRGGLLLWQRARKNIFECTFTVLFLISLSEKAKCMSVHTHTVCMCQAEGSFFRCYKHASDLRVSLSPNLSDLYPCNQHGHKGTTQPLSWKMSTTKEL